MQILKVLTDAEQIEKFQKYRAQRNQAAKNFKLRNMTKIKEEGKQLYDINKNKIDFKEDGRRRAKLYYEANKDAVKAKRALKTQKKEMESKDLTPSLVKTKTIKPVKEPIKPVLEDVNYKSILFTKPTKPKKIRPLKALKKVSSNELTMYN